MRLRLQVNYLGYPGTMGVPFIDYIIADRFVIPDERRHHYSEKIVCLPDTFQVNDSRRPPVEVSPSREECGLPAHAFVFCAFNTAHKITPLMFDIWMRLLKGVEHSVLWLVSNGPEVENRLRQEATSRGVGAERLIFAPRTNYWDYLKRYRCADLFLDTLPFNGGTTVSDALWAGLPVVACSGEAFASRMAGSLLKASDCRNWRPRACKTMKALRSSWRATAQCWPTSKRGCPRTETAAHCLIPPGFVATSNPLFVPCTIVIGVANRRRISMSWGDAVAG